MDSIKFVANGKTLGRMVKSDTLAVRLTPMQYSTDKAKWVNDKLGNVDITPLVVFPESNGRLQYVFPDTVVVRVYTPLDYLEKEGKIVDGTLRPRDPAALSPLVQSIFGVKGDYQNVVLVEGNQGYQDYRISTCNIPLNTVYGICQDILDGKYTYLDKPIGFVRLDITTNVSGAVAPSEYGDPNLLRKGWDYRDNAKYVGDCCHSYIVETSNGSPLVETKIYDKFRYMLEVGAVADTIGDNLANILDSNQTNIRLAFHDPIFQAQGFGRIESRFWYRLPCLDILLEKHIGYLLDLVDAHCQPTSFQDSWDSFLQANHCQTAVVVYNKDRDTYQWTIARWVNRKTDKANGFSGTGLESFQHAIKHRTMGLYGVNVYRVLVESGQSVLDSTTYLLPDRLHTANLIDIGEGKTSKASVVSQKYQWDMVGLALPFSLSAKCGKGRVITSRGEGDTTSVDEGTLASVESLEKAAKKAEARKAKREQDALQKYIAQVAVDANAMPPSDWTKHLHISKLAEVAKPICTRYVFAANLKYPTYLVKVGKKWYKANSQLSRLLDQQPNLPMAIEVWDSKKEYKGNKMWDVTIKPMV